MRNWLYLVVLVFGLEVDSQSQTANHRVTLAKKSQIKNKSGLTGVILRTGTGKIEILVAGSPFTTYYFQGYNKPIRSEERRVGKECRSRWSPYH